MFSENNQISMRQTYRLLFFDFLGLSSLILPSMLAKDDGIYGVGALLIGGVFCFLYLKLLKERFIGCFRTLSKGVRGCYLLLTGACLLSAGYVTYVFMELMQENLVAGEEYWLLTALLLLLVGYSAVGGLEGRARMYEVLFYFLVIPLFVMLLLSIKDVEIVYYDPAQASFSVFSLLKGGYQVFLCFQVLFLVLFLKDHVCAKERLTSTVTYALFTAWGVVLVMFVILVGVFGQRALGHMDFAIVTLLSAIVIPGGFVKRLDAFMLGIWFFTLFALLNLLVYYARETFDTCVGAHENARNGKRYRQIAGILVAVFVIALFLKYVGETKPLIENYFIYVQGPLLVILPYVLCKRKEDGANAKQGKNI